MPAEPAAQGRAAEMEHILNAVSASGTLELLGMTKDDLQAARKDPELFETLRITHEFLIALRDTGAMATFLALPRDDRSNFIRWLGAIDADSVRQKRMETFILALKQSPLGDFG